MEYTYTFASTDATAIVDVYQSTYANVDYSAETAFSLSLLIFLINHNNNNIAFAETATIFFSTSPDSS